MAKPSSFFPSHRISQSFEIQRRVRRAAATHQAPAATAVVPSLGHGEGHVAGGHHAVLEHEVWSPGVRLSMLSYDCEIGMIF